jgi:hypothetical protein
MVDDTGRAIVIANDDTSSGALGKSRETGSEAISKNS